MGTIKINKNNNETNKDKTKLELFIEKQSALQNDEATAQTAKEAEQTALSAATATKNLSNGNQIVLSGEENGITFYQTVQNYEDDTTDTYQGYLEVFYYNTQHSVCFVSYVTPASIPEGVIKSVKLVLTCEDGAGEIYVDNVMLNPQSNKLIDVEIDVTNSQKGSVGIFPGTKESCALFTTSGPKAPRLIIEYVEFPNSFGDNQYMDDTMPSIKNFKLTDKADGRFYIKEGGIIPSFKSFDSSDFILPINISHFHKNGVGNIGYGTDWSINLNKKLKVADDDSEKTTRYVYTDEIGDKYLLIEKYYYIDGVNKYFVNKNEVKIDIDGSLKYKDFTVYTCQESCGNILIPYFDDFKNIELIEQRKDEQIQLEEFINQYEPILQTYVKVNSKNGEIISRLSNLTKDEVESMTKEISNISEDILMTESESMQLKSLIFGISQLDNQIAQLQLQQRQLSLQEKQLKNQLAQISNTKTISEKVFSGNNQINWNIQKEDDVSVAQYKANYLDAVNNEKMIKGVDGDSQQKLLGEQVIMVNNQINLVLTQIEQSVAQKDYIISQARSNLQTIKDNFIKYFSKKAQLDLLLKQIPLNYLKNPDGLINGFNKFGDLVLLCDSYGNYVNFTYNSDNQIDSIFDSRNKKMLFVYSENCLQSITDSRGRTVKYFYNEDKLIKVSFADDSWLEFEYQSGNIRSVISSDDIQAKLSFYDNKRLKALNINSKPISIGTNLIIEKDSFSKSLSTVNIEYGFNQTTISNNNNETEIFTFDREGRVLTLEKIDNTFTKNKTTFKYIYRIGKEIESTITSDIDEDKSVIEKYNKINQLISKESAWTNISDTVKTKTLIDYFYDINNNLIEEITKTMFLENDLTSEMIQHKKYCYNAQGSLILTESFIEGEELTSGKNYEERVYDENGNLTKTISWNSLDSASKFYSETEYSEIGQVTAEKDEIGESSTEYEYISGTNIVNSVKYSNGSKLAYGRNSYNNMVTSVTQSTDDGEENSTRIIYERNLPVQVKSDKTVIDYTYDFSRRKTKVEVNGAEQCNYTYKDYTYNNNQNKCTFSEQTTTLKDGNVSTTFLSSKTGVLDETSGRILVTESSKINGVEQFKKTYDVDGQLKTSVDYITNLTSNFTYDKYGNISNIVSAKVNETYAYNQFSEIISKTVTGAVNHTYIFGYKQNPAHSLDYIGFGDYKFKPLSDVNGRNTGKEIYSSATKVAGEYISYRKVGDHATNMPSTIWYASGEDIKDNLKYKYDKSGNICEITENGHIVAKYAYDGLNRLVREDNKPLNKTVVYTYDNCGNITERCEYAYTRKSGEELTELDCTHFAYEYDGDRLVSYNGEKCAYNNLGSPTTYRDKQAQWQFGTRLRSLGAAAFNYDGFGKRIKKNNIEFVYDSDGRLIKQSDGLEFVYDDKGVVGIKHNSTQYFYRRDIQGNIIAILDESGAVVVRYIYDAWGNHAVLDVNGNDIEDMSHIGNVNPFRYRGYYYDVETGFYYLKSRYYDPETGRFISQDSIDYADPESINGLNLYAYCGNNPVMNVDPTGKSLIGCLVLLIIGIVASGVINGVVAGANAAEGESFWSAFAGGFVNGVISGIGLAVGLAVAVGGGIGALVVGGIIAAGFGFAGGVAGSAVTQKITYGEVDKNVALIAGAISAGNNLLMFAGLSVAGVYSTAPKFLTRVMQNLLFDVIPVSMSVFWGTLPMLNPNDLRDKFGK